MAEKRTREFGIRKVLGADSTHIIKLLSTEFFWLITIASVIAWILSWLLISNWLQNFAYRTSLNWVMFLCAATIAMVFALAITTIKAWYVSRSNPVETLKHD
jgi:putative ABC transport system permease protein